METSDSDIKMNTNPNALQFHRKVIGNGDFQKTYYIPHHMLLSHNLHSQSMDMDCDVETYKPFPFKCTFPLPLLSTKDTYNASHTGLEYSDLKDAWQRKVTATKTNHERKKNKCRDPIKISNSEVCVPMYVINFATLLEEDPDPYYDSYFNWYLSGNGNLWFSDVIGTSYMFYVHKNKLNVGQQDHIVEDKNNIQYTCENNKPIHETRLGIVRNNHIVGLRQKHSINLVHFSEESNTLGLKLLKTIQSEVPFTSFAFSQPSNGIYYVDICGNLCLEDIESDQVTTITLSVSGDVKNNWSSIQLVNSNVLLKTDKKHVKLLDTRENYETTDVYSLNGLDCDVITCSRISHSKSYNAYIGTLHSLYLYDMRFTKPDKPFVSKWTHGLKFPPLFISTNTLQDKEIISLTSELNNESCLITNSNSTNYSRNQPPNSDLFTDQIDNSLQCDQDSEFYIPYHPKCIPETLKIAQLQGYCLDPTLNLKKRFNTSRTGAALRLNDNGELNLYTINSFDVYCQSIIASYQMPDGESLCESLELWANKLLTSKFPFVVSSQINLAKFQSVFRSKNKKFQHIKRPLGKKFLQKTSIWKNSIEGLGDFTDLCADELLSVWDINNKPMEGLDATPTDTNFKIDSWMSNFHILEKDPV